MRSLNRQKKRGFSLIELLVTIAIISILIALLLPAIQQARAAARRTQCQNNLKQIALALHSYHELHRMFPQGQVYRGPTGGVTREARAPGWNWSSMILPMIDQAPLYNKFNFSLPLHDASQSQFIGTILETFLCPSDASAEPHVKVLGNRPYSTLTIGLTIASSNYCANAGSFNVSQRSIKKPLRANGVMFQESTISFSDITDGASNTILMGEAKHFQINLDPNLYGRWNGTHGTAGPSRHAMRTGYRRLNPLSIADETVKEDAFSSFHEGGAFFAFADGSVRFISESIEHTQREWNNFTKDDPFDLKNNGAAYGTYQRLFSRNDSLSLGEF